MLDRNILQDCLLAIGSISHTEITEVVSEIYYDNLKDLPSDQIKVAFRTIIINGKFPAIGQIRELATGITADADWHTIIAVASGSKKSAIISGISAIALTTATATSSILAALRKISFCDDPYTLREIRKDWSKLVSVPKIESALPPADVEITLSVKLANNDFEYPPDDDFSIRTASMIRCIRDKGSVSPVWMNIIDKFPAAKKREILDAVEVNNWVTPALKESKLYRKYQTTAEAMREIDEAVVNKAILDSRKPGMPSHRGEVGRAIGNAVPPALAKAVGLSFSSMTYISMG